MGKAPMAKTSNPFSQVHTPDAWVYRNTGDYGFPVCDKKRAEKREYALKAALAEIDNHYQADEELPPNWGR